ncbi:MAG: hypothetical protein V2J24_05350 [Pseudomonadales bacterium]|jgi:hypothetical protein|nr:hypothetical protein [Pseudomonadales bacterium]
MRNILGWIGIVLVGLAHGLLEDLMFFSVLMPYAPLGWDLTGDLFWVFTVPLAQLMALAVTIVPAWFLLAVHRPPRLMTFWACWSLARAAFLTFAKNPVGDILTYLLWIAFWCALIGLLAHLMHRRRASP